MLGEAPGELAVLPDHCDVERVIFGGRLAGVVGEDAHVVRVVPCRAHTPLSAPATRPSTHDPTEGDVVRMRRRSKDQLAGDGASEVEDVLTRTGLRGQGDAPGLRGDSSIGPDQRPLRACSCRSSRACWSGWTGSSCRSCRSCWACRSGWDLACPEIGAQERTVPHLAGDDRVVLELSGPDARSWNDDRDCGNARPGERDEKCNGCHRRRRRRPQASQESHAGPPFRLLTAFSVLAAHASDEAASEVPPTRTASEYPAGGRSKRRYAPRLP